MISSDVALGVAVFFFYLAMMGWGIRCLLHQQYRGPSNPRTSVVRVACRVYSQRQGANFTTRGKNMIPPRPTFVTTGGPRALTPSALRTP